MGETGRKSVSELTGLCNAHAWNIQDIRNFFWEPQMGETGRKGVSGLTGAAGAGPAVSFCIQLSATPRHHNHQHNQRSL